MKSAPRLRPISLSFLALSTAFSCGGTPSGGAASPASSTSNAAEHCLAVAGAKHSRKPSEPDRILAKHVLVRYAGAKRASESIKRTREQACLRAEEALAKLHEGMSWAEVVRLYSDESGAETREGTLGTIERKDVAPPVADAAFELGIREASLVVESDFGFHVILRTE